MMMKSFRFAAMAAASTLSILANTSGVMADHALLLTLSGDDEVPSVKSTAMGSFSMEYHESAESISWELEIMNPDEISIFGAPGAHIHCGKADENGPVLVSLVGPNMPDDSDHIKEKGTITKDSIIPDLCFGTVSEIWEAIMAGKGLYVNVHSVENPSGELRGNVEDAKAPRRKKKSKKSKKSKN